MIAIYFLVLQLLKLYSYVVIANVIISWLIAFNVLNTSNRFVYSVLEFTYNAMSSIVREGIIFTSNHFNKQIIGEA